MKLPGEYIDPEMEKLRSSNNQQEDRLDIHSDKIKKLEIMIKGLEKWKHEQFMRQANQY